MTDSSASGHATNTRPTRILKYGAEGPWRVQVRGRWWGWNSLGSSVCGVWGIDDYDTREEAEEVEAKYRARKQKETRDAPIGWHEETRD